MMKSLQLIARKSVIRLVVVALGFLCILLYWLSAPAAHDPHWWKEAGLPANRTLYHKENHHFSDNIMEEGIFSQGVANDLRSARAFQATYEQPHEHRSISLKSSVDYIADYDVSMIHPRSKYPRHFSALDYKDPPAPTFWLSDYPRIGYVPDFLTDNETKTIMRMVGTQFVPVPDSGEVAEIGSLTEPIYQRLTDRIKAYFGSHFLKQEFSVLKLTVGEAVNLHTEFPPSTRQEFSITAYFWLQESITGGEIAFPLAQHVKLNNKDLPWLARSMIYGKKLPFVKSHANDFSPPPVPRPAFNTELCTDQGLRFLPHSRGLLFVYNVDEEEHRVEESIHGVCQPHQGDLWMARLRLHH